MKNTQIYKTGIQEAKKIGNSNTKMTEVGSAKYFLWGSEKSEQSIVIKIGRVFERMVLTEIKSSKRFQLGTIGVQKISGQKTKKDVDLMFIDKQTKTIYYRELKANIDLDTEKLPATTDKIKIIEQHLKAQHKGYSIDSGILCMPVYSKEALGDRLQKKVDMYNKSNVKVQFANDLFTILGLSITEAEWENFGLEMGQILRS
jgi:hypothetical protein